ncbi:MAG TPA: tetratricopeptide repeat protein, partial [Pseudonocardiaceae bacterium]|nr:tetratricopeptide repeat protein [Pseudonocardiaceae bacterium]
GHDHPNTLTSAYNLARDLRALGEHEQARELSMDTLTRCQRLLADDVADGATFQDGHLRIRQLEQWIRSQYQPVKR